MEKRTFYCGKCGKPLEKASKFCPECGAEIPPEIQKMMSEEEEDLEEKNEEQNEEPDKGQNEGESEEQGGEEENKSNGILKNIHSYMGAIIGLAIGVIMIIVVLVMIIMVAKPQKVDLDPYITAECTGYDGYGMVTCDFDEETFLADYGDKIKLKSSVDTSELAEQADEEIPAELMLSCCVDYELTFSQEDVTNGQLSNDDTITLVWDCDDSLAKDDFKVKLTYSDMEYEVEGLDDLTSTDVFEDIDVEFSGTAPEGEAAIVVSSDQDGIDASDFTISADKGLQNGDTVTVALTEESVDRLREEGENPQTTEKEYTVEGLDSYLTKISDIPEDTLKTLREKAEEKIKNEVVKTAVDGVTIQDMNDEGCYLVSKNSGDGYANTLYLVYKVNAEAKIKADNVDETFSFYTYVSFKDLILNADKTLNVDADTGSLCSDTYTREFGKDAKGKAKEKGEYFGYGSLDELLEKIQDPDAETDSTIQAETGEENS